MKPDFWLERWEREEIGFHRASVHWALATYWQQIAVDSHAPVLVPLCGKSIDLHWLMQYGHHVVGVELSPKAIIDFFAEWGRSPEQKTNLTTTCWQAENIRLIQGNFFEFHPKNPFQYFYDRAALIALPETMRSLYLDHLISCLTAQSSGLLITLEYDQQKMDGPPFSVTHAELSGKRELYFDQLARRDVLDEYSHFAQQGLDYLFETTYRVTRIKK